MSEFWVFVQVGFRHVTDVGALDHVLFLLVLAAIYRMRDWRRVVWVVSAFTVGHSASLVLSATDTVVLPEPIVEFLIPITIVATGAENLIQRNRAAAGQFSRNRVAFAAIFGLVHGAGYATHLRSLFLDSIVLPLLGFNLGIEIGQLVALGLIVALLRAVDHGISLVVRTTEAFRIRLVGTSSIAIVIAMGWAMARLPR